MNLAFYFPYYEVSGVPVLFSNIANHIANNTNIKVSIIDYSDGYMSCILKNNKSINRVSFETGKKCFVDQDVLVMQSIFPFGMRPELEISKTTKILFWNLHPNNLIPNVYPWAVIAKSSPRLYKKLVTLFWTKKYQLMKSFIEAFWEAESLTFMDSANIANTEFFYSIKLNSVKFLPIACSDGYLVETKFKNEIKSIHVSWVGRLCDFKIHILNYFISQLSDLARKLEINIILHIIGDGPEEANLLYKKRVNNFFQAKKIGKLSKVEMDEYLINEIDINASMGTSVLESAKYGIPSIVLDYDFKPIKNGYIFRWLHNTKNFDLGHVITKLDYRDSNSSLSDMLKEFMSNRIELSKKTYEYYSSNHSLDSISKSIINQTKKAKKTISDIDKKLIQKGFIRYTYEYFKYKKKIQ